MNLNITLCTKCNCMTHSIRKGRGYYLCGKCGNDKSLSDVFFNEAQLKQEARKLRKVKK